MQFKSKKVIAVGATFAAAGATAAILFGGTAVSTAFTSASTGNYVDGQGATSGVQVTGGQVTAKNLVPGADPVDGGQVTATNTGSSDAVLSVSFGDYTVVANGKDGNPPKASELEINVPGIGTATADQLAGQKFTLTTLGAGKGYSADVQEALTAGTGNEWSGAEAYLPFTVTLTAGSS